VNAVRQLLCPLQQAGSFFNVAGGDLAGAELDHLVNKLRIEEALLLGLSCAGALFKGIERLLIRNLVVNGRGKSRDRECAEQN
jgi:hypothetical protein